MRVLRNMATNRLTSLEFTPSIGCPVNCRFCPQEAVLEGYYGNAARTQKPSLLSVENFKLFHSRMDNHEERPIVSFCGMGESFINPDLPSMIRYAHERNAKICLMTTLVGTTKAALSSINDVPFLTFVIHIPDEEMNSKFIITDRYLDTLAYALDTFRVDSLSCHGHVHHSVEEMVNASKLPIQRAMHDRGGLVVDPLIQPTQKRETGRVVCGLHVNASTDFNQHHGRAFNNFERFPQVVPSVRPDGSVVPCCMDFSANHILGNLLTQSWEEIIQGEECQKFMKGAYENIGTLCRRCPSAVPVHHMPSDRLKRFLQGGVENERLRAILLENDPDGFMCRLLNANSRAIIGLGSLFLDHYFLELWDEAIEADVFVDNNANLWDKKLKGMALPSKAGVVESPSALNKYPGVFVITFCGRENDRAIGRQLEAMNIGHANIMDIFDILTCPDVFNHL